MIDWPPDDNEEGRLPPLGTMLAELARRRRVDQPDALLDQPIAICLRGFAPRHR